MERLYRRSEIVCFENEPGTICNDWQIELFAFSKTKFDRLTTIPIPNFNVWELIFSAEERELVINNGEEILFGISRLLQTQNTGAA